MKSLTLLPTLLFCLGTLAVSAQTDRRIEEQKQKIAALEKKIADEEREISQLKQGKTANEQKARRLARQIESRNQLLDETEKQAHLLREELARTDSIAGSLSASLEHSRTQYAQMVREAYRNYKQNNYLTYLFSSKNFTDVARRISNLRSAARFRERRLSHIDSLSRCVTVEKELLDARKRALDSVTDKLRIQKERLQRDARTARANVKQMSKREQEMLRQKVAKEQQLDIAVDELRKLTKGNREGISFSGKTSGLRLPVTAGRVKKYKGNMAEIIGPRGAHVISIYQGRVVEIQRNRITNKYDVYIAHGEYLSSYANLGSICCEKGQKVTKNQQIGTIGSSVDILTMETEYKVVFGIYSPDPREAMRAEQCFRK